MTRLLKLLVALSMAALAVGCAHPISLNADLARVLGTGAATKIDKKVALVINDDMRNREVTTPGGGGDKVSYRPYRDLEAGLYVALNESFTSVSRVTGPTDSKLATDGLQLVVTPTLSTTSHSPSIATWPPTIFTIEINLAISTPQQAPVTQVRVQGEGRAEFNEFVSNVSLSATRAAEDALKKLVVALREAASKLP